MNIPLQIGEQIAAVMLWRILAGCHSDRLGTLMTFKRLIFAGALTAMFALGVAVAPASADSIQYTLKDNTGDVIAFTLAQFPTLVATNADWFAAATLVTIDGISSMEDVTFYDNSFLGGLSIASTPFTDQIIDQSGPVLFSGSTTNPKLLPETNVSLTCTAISPAPACSGNKYTNAFTLKAVDIKSTPEPSSLALMLAGLGLVGLMVGASRR
jgi:hypothetical protein